MLTYTPEAEAFRKEVKSWLVANLPKGWFDDGFELPANERKKFNAEWPSKLFEGGWICATWPKEYGGKGLNTLQGVVLAEEFATKHKVEMHYSGMPYIRSQIMTKVSQEMTLFLIYLRRSLIN
jgi:alkylation response protein AidB-like acyl-CoA dehydrogenase